MPSLRSGKYVETSLPPKKRLPKDKSTLDMDPDRYNNALRSFYLVSVENMRKREAALLEVARVYKGLIHEIKGDGCPKCGLEVTTRSWWTGGGRIYCKSKDCDWEYIAPKEIYTPYLPRLDKICGYNCKKHYQESAISRRLHRKKTELKRIEAQIEKISVKKTIVHKTPYGRKVSRTIRVPKESLLDE